MIVACAVVPKVTNAFESAIWSQAQQNASLIRQNATIFCLEKGKNWPYWNNVNIYELGFTYDDLDGKYFKHDSYSIDFWGYNDFLVKIKVTDTTKGAIHFKKYMLTLDENGTWGFIEKP